MLSAQIFMNVNSLIIHDLGINITICNTVNSKIFSVITLNSIEYGLLSLNSIKTPSRPSIYDTTIFTCIPKLFVWFVARKLDRIFCLVVINQLVSLFRSFNKTKWFLVHSVSLVVHSNFALNLQSCARNLHTRKICRVTMLYNLYKSSMIGRPRLQFDWFRRRLPKNSRTPG
mgnify:FL=1